MKNEETPIAMDATEVAYIGSFRAKPRILKVVRHTPTQVRIEGIGRAFTRERGQAIGGHYRDSHIANVTQKIRDQMAAAELHEGAKALFALVWEAQEKKHGAEREALRKLGIGKEGETPTEVRAAVARLSHFAKEQFSIEVDVAVEKNWPKVDLEGTTGLEPGKVHDLRTPR